MIVWWWRLVMTRLKVGVTAVVALAPMLRTPSVIVPWLSHRVLEMVVRQWLVLAMVGVLVVVLGGGWVCSWSYVAVSTCAVVLSGEEKVVRRSWL